MLKNFFRENGLPLVLVEETGKYFPETFSSLDVVELLKKKMLSLNIEIMVSTKIEKIQKKLGIFSIFTDRGVYNCDNLVLATGGKSYPEVGTTGDGYVIAKEFGHKIIPPKPALTPIYVRDYIFQELSGISFQNVRVAIWRENKKIIEKNGAVLLTHTNFSGPAILDNSRFVENGSQLEINYVGKEYVDLNKELIEETNRNGKKTIKKFLAQYFLPERFVKTILSVVNVDGELKLAELSREKRESLIKLLTSNRMEITKVGGFEVAMVTRGGVSLDEVNSKTLESKKLERLYLVGEILDIDGDTGGYNIQAACSMGVLAGKSMGRKERE